MAHASSREKAGLQIKKLKKAKAKRKAEEYAKREEMGEEEYLALQKKKAERDLKQVVSTAVWDIKHKQFPMSKKSYIMPMMEERIKQIDVELEEKASQDMDFNPIFLKEEKRTIEVVLNDLRS